MLYKDVECPHCGNEVTVSNQSDVQKCCWCRRLISVKFGRSGKGKRKIVCKVDAMDFPNQFPPSYYFKEGEKTDGVQHRGRNPEKSYKG